jgi:predicted GNAT superfamily acetyltransferase
MRIEYAVPQKTNNRLAFIFYLSFCQKLCLLPFAFCLLPCLYSATMSDEEITIRECLSIDDFQQCIELERRVWNDDDIDIMPIRLYMISKNCNAPTFGAFTSTGRIIGFVHTSLALIDQNIAYHSHLAGVVEELRHKDIGYKLKLAQRQHAIAANVPMIFWSFDPLQSRNAHFNINKLGAIIRTYKINYYGEGVSSVFDSHLPSDRVIAEWWIGSPQVESVLNGNRPKVESPDVNVEIPDNVDEIRAQSLEEHVNWRMRVREDFLKALEQGNIVRGFARDVEKKTSVYLFGQDEEPFHFAERE